MTPKQTLLAHIAEMHRWDGKGRQPPKSWTQDKIAYWHAHEHHHVWVNHYHEGPNTGPDQRPPGWKTGEDAVVKP